MLMEIKMTADEAEHILSQSLIHVKENDVNRWMKRSFTLGGFVINTDDDTGEVTLRGDFDPRYIYDRIKCFNSVVHSDYTMETPENLETWFHSRWNTEVQPVIIGLGFKYLESEERQKVDGPSEGHYVMVHPRIEGPKGGDKILRVRKLSLDTYKGQPWSKIKEHIETTIDVLGVGLIKDEDPNDKIVAEVCFAVVSKYGDRFYSAYKIDEFIDRIVADMRE